MSDITESTPAVEVDVPSEPEMLATTGEAAADAAESTDSTEAADAVENAESASTESSDAPVGDTVVEPAVSVADITAGSADEEANMVDGDSAEGTAEDSGDGPADESTGSADDDTADDTEDEAESAAPRRRRDSPYDRPGRWYVIHTQSGYENKVRSNLLARTQSMNMEERIFEVVIPMEDVVEFKNGKKVIVQKKVFPGYLLTRMHLDDDSWFVVRNTPGVTGFIGAGNKPSPLPRKDVENFLVVKEDGDDTARKGRPRLEYTMGETVRVKEGPFADFQGEIVEINEDQLRLKVLVNIFGRETPVELQFAEVAKI